MRTRRNVVVAGGAGFIGSHLCEALVAEGARVLAVDNLVTGRVENLAGLAREPNFDLLEHDVVEPLPASVRADEIHNLACAASPPQYQADPIHTMLTSVIGTRNLLALAAEQGARLLQASTSEVYGDPDVHPQVESYHGNVNPTGPRACYDEGKRAAETLCFDYRRTHGASVRVARIFNTYGPNMRADDGRVISNIICQALANETLTVYGNGLQTRSFCYVDDIVEGLVRLMAHPGEDVGPVNLGNPSEIAVRDLVARIVTLTGTRSRVIERPLPTDDPRKRRPDIGRAIALLGWEPRVSLDEGLPRTVDWFAALAGETAPSRRKAARRSRRVLDAADDVTRALPGAA